MITIILSNGRHVDLAADDADDKGGVINMWDVAAQLSDADAIRFVHDLVSQKSRSFCEDLKLHLFLSYPEDK